MDLANKLKQIEPFSELNMNLSSVQNGEVTLTIPLEGNRNDKGTMFAGSIYSTMVLTGWSLATVIAASEPGEHDVVIGESRTRYLRPVTSDAKVVATLGNKHHTQRTNGNLEIHAVVKIFDEEGKTCAKLTGSYVAVTK